MVAVGIHPPEPDGHAALRAQLHEERLARLVDRADLAESRAAVLRADLVATRKDAESREAALRAELVATRKEVANLVGDYKRLLRELTDKGTIRDRKKPRTS